MSDPSDRSNRLPSLDTLRKRARQWLRALQSGDTQAVDRLARALPRHGDPPRLREVQQALAREHGFASWAALREHLQAEAGTGGEAAALHDVFLEHACIFTPPVDFASKWRRAERIRVRHPWIATASLHAAVVSGEVEEVRARLAREPDAVRRRGGPQQWEPLLFACYGRLPRPEARERGLEMIRLLLAAGADPDTHFVSPDAWRLRFTALTGVMGQGEMGQPEHPQAEAAARLLLERGADPNDGQGLYDTCLAEDDTRWLELLHAHGLRADAPIRWHADPADAAKSGADRCATIFGYLLAQAATSGHVRRLRWLLEHGADPDARSIYDGRSCLQLARIRADDEAVALLRRHGAREEPLEGHDAFVAAVRSGARATAEAALAAHPEYRDVADPLTDAAARGDVAVVRLLLELGVDPDGEGRHGHRALHNACRHPELARLLLAHGADPRSRAYGGTAAGWALHADDPRMARFFAEQSRSLLDAAMCGHVELARQLLAADAGCIAERDPRGNGPLHLLCADPELGEPLVDLLLAHGADPEARNDEGETPAERLDRAGADEVADLLRAAL